MIKILYDSSHYGLIMLFINDKYVDVCICIQIKSYFILSAVGEEDDILSPSFSLLSYPTIPSVFFSLSLRPRIILGNDKPTPAAYGFHMLLVK